jgi:hypothetical protein
MRWRVVMSSGGTLSEVCIIELCKLCRVVGDWH